MVDSVCFMVEEFSEGEEFRKGDFDDIEEFFAGDTVELVCWVEEDGCTCGGFVGTLGVADKFFV